MTVMRVESFTAGEWRAPSGAVRVIESPLSGDVIAEAGHDTDAAAMLAYAHRGGAALRAMSFHDRARMLKALAGHLHAQRDPLYALSFNTGATAKDNLIDVDGGIGATFVFASKGRREMPDAQVYLDGPVEPLSRRGSFVGRHIAVPKQGVAVHINAYNFPVWGMLEKLAPTLLAGMPAIVKPATASCYVTELAFRMMIQSGLLPEGAIQLICGSTGDLLDHLGGQDVVSFTGSANTAAKLRATPALLAGSVPFIAEQDSLNAAILAPDALPGTPEFDLFIKEATHEITVKAGQKCTAMRRLIVPDPAPVIEALGARLQATRVGDPRQPATQMGALISQSQRADVLEKAETLAADAELVAEGTAPRYGAFLPPRLYHASDPDRAARVHDTEAFGPIATVLGYRDLDHAAALANRGAGSLVASVFTHDAGTARDLTHALASHHGRVYLNNRDCAAEATGHGAPLPHLVHGGPGRAGGGEEQGGIRGVMHYMQRTAVQGTPDTISAIGDAWVPGGREVDAGVHPFRRSFTALEIGETLHTEARDVTLEDIEHFAQFTGDEFYGHMDETAAAANPFFPGRVAHGYLLLSFAAGLFVDPDPGPVLANTGLDGLRFLKPVSPGDRIRVRLTVKQKTKRNDDYGEVRWHVTLTNQDGEICAEYELLTMNAI